MSVEITCPCLHQTDLAFRHYLSSNMSAILVLGWVAGLLSFSQAALFQGKSYVTLPNLPMLCQ